MSLALTPRSEASVPGGQWRATRPYEISTYRVLDRPGQIEDRPPWGLLDGHPPVRALSAQNDQALSVFTQQTAPRRLPGSVVGRCSECERRFPNRQPPTAIVVAVWGWDWIPVPASDFHELPGYVAA